MEDKKSFGSFIAEKRKALRYTQKELAHQLNISETAVSKWERGVSQTKGY
ncbi:MAG: helix-turn-helix domain-containing protein [Beduini sp.]